MGRGRGARGFGEGAEDEVGTEGVAEHMYGGEEEGVFEVYALEYQFV